LRLSIVASKSWQYGLRRSTTELLPLHWVEFRHKPRRSRYVTDARRAGQFFAKHEDEIIEQRGARGGRPAPQGRGAGFFFAQSKEA